LEHEQDSLEQLENGEREKLKKLSGQKG